MLGASESPQWVAEMLGHSTVEMVFRRYARFIPNLTRKDGSAATKWLAGEGHRMVTGKHQGPTGCPVRP
jgi:integrase